MMSVFPRKLKKGDEVGVIASSRSLSIISENTRKIANENLKKVSLNPIYSKNAEENNNFNSPPIEKKITDINEMFLDNKIKAIFSAIGGYSSNQLLKYIDWGLIKNNPKIFCGYSDTTVLSNAIHTKTGLVTYIGPHYSTFGQKHHLEYTIEYFQKCCFQIKPYEIHASNYWRDDEWWVKQDEVNLEENKGPKVINPGSAQGVSIGGNLSGLISLAGTDFFPDLKDSILFVEVTGDYKADHFDNELQTLILQNGFNSVKGLLIGRFQRNSNISEEDIELLVKSKKELSSIPVVYNLDFGHTYPLFTFPVGGQVELEASNGKFVLNILKH